MEPVERVATLQVVSDAMDAEPDEAHLFEMSPAGAEQVTIQIRSMLERAWEYIAIACQGRAYLALGYRTWDEYADDRLGDLRLTVPRVGYRAQGEPLFRCWVSHRSVRW